MPLLYQQLHTNPKTGYTDLSNLITKSIVSKHQTVFIILDGIYTGHGLYAVLPNFLLNENYLSEHIGLSFNTCFES